MAFQHIIYVRFPIELDSDKAEDTTITTVLDGLLAPLDIPNNYELLTTSVIPPSGTRTKAMVVVIFIDTNP